MKANSNNQNTNGQAKEAAEYNEAAKKAAAEGRHDSAEMFRDLAVDAQQPKGRRR